MAAFAQKFQNQDYNGQCPNDSINGWIEEYVKPFLRKFINNEAVLVIGVRTAEKEMFDGN
jgi:hypothetical protein